jgi:hypothetical protein
MEEKKMALTTMIKKDEKFKKIIKEHLPSKKLFTTNVDLPAFSSKYIELVPYRLSYQYYSTIVGSAFDYMARFIVAKVVRKTDENVLNDTVASLGLNRIRVRVSADLYAKLKKQFDSCIIKIKNYLDSNDKNYVEMIPSAFYFAKLDGMFRSGGLPPKDGYESLLDVTNPDILLDIENLSSTFYKIFISGGIVNPSSVVVFNPKFGDLSCVCGGADADIFIDGTLYDFKTSKELGYSWDEVGQIYGYYLLDCMRKIAKDELETVTLQDLRIDKIAFYRSRYGIIESFDVTNISQDDLIDTLAKMKEHLYGSTTINILESVRKSIDEVKLGLKLSKNKEDKNNWEKLLADSFELLSFHENRWNVVSNLNDIAITEWVINLKR